MESVLIDHPRVQEVAVVGLPDPEGVRGEEVAAFVVPAGAEADGTAGDTLAAELDRWCGARVADVERPRRIAVGANLPRTAMGKPSDW